MRDESVIVTSVSSVISVLADWKRICASRSCLVFHFLEQEFHYAITSAVDQVYFLKLPTNYYFKNAFFLRWEEKKKCCCFGNHLSMDAMHL